MALCALGLISSDATLAGAALGELMKRGNGEIKQRGLKEKKCDTVVTTVAQNLASR